MHNKDKGLTDYEQTSTDVKSNRWSKRVNDGRINIQVVLDEIVVVYTAVTLCVYKCVKKVLPDGDHRRWLLLDMAVVLAHGRGQIVHAPQ